jgi:type II secretion system protein H
MNKPSHHLHQLQLRGGFSLVELLIVMAVLAAVAGLVLPSMRGPLDKSRLTGAAKELQASLAKARSLAIRESSLVSFRYEIAGGRYVIERIPAPVNATITVLEDPSGAATTPSGLTTESAEAPAQPIDGTGESNLISMTLREGRLPVGVTFAEPVTSGLITSEASATNLRRWSDPIRFQPSGRTEDATIRVTGQRDFVVDVTLRGLTAMASYSAPTRVVPQQTPTTTDTAEALP